MKKKKPNQKGTGQKKKKDAKIVKLPNEKAIETQIKKDAKWVDQTIASVYFKSLKDIDDLLEDHLKE